MKVSLLGAVLGENKSLVFIVLNHDPHSQYLSTISLRLFQLLHFIIRRSRNDLLKPSIIHNRVTEVVLDCLATVRILFRDNLLTFKVKETGVRTLEKADTTVAYIFKLSFRQLNRR